MISPGTILIESGTPVPKSFRLESEACPSAWISLKHSLSSHELENELTSAGWTFVSTASEVRATAFGFDRQKMVRSALKRLIASAKLQNCNCLEIDEVETHAFCGMPYMSVTAFPRQIQQGSVLCEQ